MRSAGWLVAGAEYSKPRHSIGARELGHGPPPTPHLVTLQLASSRAPSDEIVERIKQLEIPKHLITNPVRSKRRVVWSILLDYPRVKPWTISQYELD
jgi:hypothetical protein